MEQVGLIYTAIPLIIGDMEAIEKKARNNTQVKYAYRGIDEFMNGLNPLLAKHKVSIVPQVIKNDRETYTNANGTRMTNVVLEVRYNFIASDGSSVSAITIGEAFDSGDKASNKAMSVALKYAIMQVFMVPTEEIDDPDHYDPSELKKNSVVETKKDFSPSAELKKVLQKPKEETPLDKFNEIDGLGAYVIQGGKYQGKCLKDIDTFDLSNYIDWMKKNSFGGKKMSASTSEFVEKAELYLKSLEFKKGS